MEGDLRYKVEHLGDNLIGMFKKVIGPSKTSSRCVTADTGKDLRYKVEHIGDSFAGLIGNVSDAAKASAKGVILTYDIRQVARKKERLISAIGARVVQLNKEDSSLSQDEQTRGLLAQLDETEDRVCSLMDEREQMLKPARSSCTKKANTQSMAITPITVDAAQSA